jgi:O-antigen ligase
MPEMSTPASYRHSHSPPEVSWQERFIIRAFCFLGPIGCLVPVPGTPHSFRFYYLLLPIGIAVFLRNGVAGKTFSVFRLLLPALIYMAVSAVVSFFSGAGGSSAEEENPVIRVGLFVTLLIFVLLAGERVLAERRSEPTIEVLRERSFLLRLMLLGYAVSLLAGFVIFVGYIQGRLSIDQVGKVEVLAQEGYGLLRFAPGSYPNEYGIVSSFVLSVLTLLILRRRTLQGNASFLPVRRIWLFPMYLGTLMALFLATTRAAYVAYMVCLLYLIMLDGSVAAKVRRAVGLVVVFVAVLAAAQYFYDILAILNTAYVSLADKDASAYERVIAWNRAWVEFAASPLLGTGFGSQDGIHNIYLQMLFELGVLGFVLLFASVGLLLSGLRARALSSYPELHHSDWQALGRVKVIGIVHVLWFGLSNHNLNHFLTWFVVLLIYMASPPKKKVASLSDLRAGYPGVSIPLKG